MYLLRVKIGLIWVLLFGNHFINAQNSNPFDISVDAVSDTIETQLDTLVPEKTQNLFDVRIGEEAIQKIEVTKSMSLSEAENPFEVDHIPLRKSQVEQKIKATKTSSRFNQSEKSSFYYLPLIIILLSCIILGLVLIRSREIISSILRSLNNLNFSKGFQRDEKGGISFGLLGIYLIYFLNAALFIFLMLKTLSSDINIYFRWVLIAVFGVYFIRHLLLKSMSVLFYNEKVVSPYNFMIQLVNSTYGVVLIPLNLLLAYGPDLLGMGIIYLSVFLFFALLILRYFRGFELARQLKAGFSFHFFIYFCTFEILPWLIGLKFLSQFNS